MTYMNLTQSLLYHIKQMKGSFLIGTKPYEGAFTRPAKKKVVAEKPNILPKPPAKQPTPPPAIEREHVEEKPVPTPKTSLLEVLHIRHSKQLPDDTKAKWARTRYKEKRFIPLIVDAPNPMYDALASAITAKLFPCRVMKKRDIDPSHAVFSIVAHNVTLDESLLFEKPSITLFDPSAYAASPEKKRQLWNEICQQITTLGLPVSS